MYYSQLGFYCNYSFVHSLHD